MKSEAHKAMGLLRELSFQGIEEKSLNKSYYSRVQRVRTLYRRFVLQAVINLITKRWLWHSVSFYESRTVRSQFVCRCWRSFWSGVSRSMAGPIMTPSWRGIYLLDYFQPGKRAALVGGRLSTSFPSSVVPSHENGLNDQVPLLGCVRLQWCFFHPHSVPVGRSHLSGMRVHMSTASAGQNIVVHCWCWQGGDASGLWIRVALLSTLDLALGNVCRAEPVYPLQSLEKSGLAAVLSVAGKSQYVWKRTVFISARRFRVLHAAMASRVCTFYLGRKSLFIHIRNECGQMACEILPSRAGWFEGYAESAAMDRGRI